MNQDYHMPGGCQVKVLGVNLYTAAENHLTGWLQVVCLWRGKSTEQGNAMIKMLGKFADETPIEYLRRVTNNLSYEAEGILEQMPSVEALCDFFDLWHVYDTDLWHGVLESIACGDNPAAALNFISKHNLSKAWAEDVADSAKLSPKNAGRFTQGSKSR